jgi:type IV pilus assembly protein PilB
MPDADQIQVQGKRLPARARRLCVALVESGRLTPAQVDRVEEAWLGTERPVEKILVDLGYATAEDVVRVVAQQQNIPFFELGSEFKMQPEEVALVPEKIARRYGLIPVCKPGESFVTLVMSDPFDLAAVDAVRSLTSMEVRRGVSIEERVLKVIEREYRPDAHIERNLKDIVDLEVGTEAVETEAAALDAEQLKVIANDAPVVKFVNLMLMQAVRDRASDIHLEPGEKTVRIRFRVDGVLNEVTPPPRRLYPAIVTRLKILSEMDISERRLPLDGRLKFKVFGREIDVRVSSLPLVNGEKIVMRILDRGSLVVDMAKIGFDPQMLARFKRVLAEPNGIILLTGPTGSGKTTTLYSALSYLNSPDVNIQTVEDPVEYVLDGINQTHVRAKIGMTFASALRAILRQDPDICLIGEIRDDETARIAMQASLTGHLVLSTLHTNDAPSSFSRMRDIGIEPYLVAATVKLVIAQRLIRLICKFCKKESTPTPEQMEIVTSVCPEAKGWTFYKGAGCDACNRTGYKGRQGVFEFLEVTNPIRQLILQKAGDVDVRELAIKQGMETLVTNSLRKLKDGVSTVEEIMAVWPMEE